MTAAPLAAGERLEGLVTPFAPPAPGEAAAGAPGVLWLRLPLPVAIDHVNVYALDDGDGWTVIDARLAWAGCRDAWARLRAGPLAGRPVRRLIVTHHRPDHIWLAGSFIANGAELWTTRTAWLYARMLTLDHHPRPTPEALRFYTRAGWSSAAGALAARAAHGLAVLRRGPRHARAAVSRGRRIARPADHARRAGDA